MAQFLSLLFRSICQFSFLGQKTRHFTNQEAILIFINSALVAQLDRASGYEPGGQRFESSPVRFSKRPTKVCHTERHINRSDDKRLAM